ncbi:unnamed protein product [Amoebophrya sp. A25]|nr:unnamed protein product [Amoebophrya sp. A25]|eukprot:GSA25T00010833001.1
MWLIAIIITPVELYSGTMLSTDRNKNRRDALRLEFHKHWRTAMLYLLEGEEVLRDMSLLFCTVGRGFRVGSVTRADRYAWRAFCGGHGDS